MDEPPITEDDLRIELAILVNDIGLHGMWTQYGYSSKCIQLCLLGRWRISKPMAAILGYGIEEKKVIVRTIYFLKKKERDKAIQTLNKKAERRVRIWEVLKGKAIEVGWQKNFPDGEEHEVVEAAEVVDPAIEKKPRRKKEKVGKFDAVIRGYQG